MILKPMMHSCRLFGVGDVGCRGAKTEELCLVMCEFGKGKEDRGMVRDTGYLCAFRFKYIVQMQSV